MTTFAEVPGPDAPPAEGWAHVMDASRCTALGVADFSRGSHDRIEIESDGRVRIARDFAGGHVGTAARTQGPPVLVPLCADARSDRRGDKPPGHACPPRRGLGRPSPRLSIRGLPIGLRPRRPRPPKGGKDLTDPFLEPIVTHFVNIIADKS